MAWDTVLLPEGNLNPDKVRDIRILMTSDELTRKVAMPVWLPVDYPSARRHYLEARQMAAAIKHGDSSLIEQLRQNKLSCVCNCVTEKILERTVKDVDVRGDTLSEFSFAVMVALLNCSRPEGCTTQEYLARIRQMLENSYQGEGARA